MAQISLAKALKLKNRLVARLAEVSSDITTYNSVLVEQVGKTGVDVMKCNALRGEISMALVDLKVAINLGNAAIQRDIYLLGEYKAEIAFYKRVSTRHGLERHGYQNTSVEYAAALQKQDIDEMVLDFERQLDSTQDKIDEYNAVTKIVIADKTLALGS